MSDKKYEGMKAVTNWIKNCSSEEFMRTFNELKDDYNGPTIGDFLGIDDNEHEEVHYDISEDFKEILEKLKQLDINISSLMFYDCGQIEEKDYYLIDDTRKCIKKCIKNIEDLSFMRDEND